MTRRADIYPTPRVEFGLALRRLREHAGLEAQQLAAQIGVSGDMVSRFELGKRAVRRPHVEAIARALELDADATADLLEQFTEAETLDKILKSTAPYRPKKMQEDRNKMLADATQIDCLAPADIPFFLQEHEYARQEVGDIVDARQVADLRVEAGRQVGAEGKQFNILIGEAALRWATCDTHAMRRQLNHLRNLTSTPRVTFGIIPFRTSLPDALKNSFTVFDEITVVDSYGGELQLTPKQAGRYLGFMEPFEPVAVRGDQALALLDAVIAALPNE